MKLKLFYSSICLGLTFAIFSPTLTSCNYEASKSCDSLAIYTKYIKEHPNLSLVDKSGMKSLKFMGNANDQPIPESVARNEHLEYLKGDLVLRDKEDKIIHYLTMDKDDLRVLADSGKEGGMRLYFSQKEEGESKYLSIIAVPVDINGDNVIHDNVTLINTLDPCPDKCALKQRYEGPNADNTPSYNSVKDLNFSEAEGGYWYKPNIDPQNPWVDKDNKPIIKK